MKILIDGRLLSSKPTGISRVTLELIKSYDTYYGKENVNVICNSSKYANQFNVILTNLKPFNIFHFFKFLIIIYEISVFEFIMINHIFIHLYYLYIYQYHYFIYYC